MFFGFKSKNKYNSKAIIFYFNTFLHLINLFVHFALIFNPN